MKKVSLINGTDLKMSDRGWLLKNGAREIALELRVNLSLQQIARAGRQCQTEFLVALAAAEFGVCFAETISQSEMTSGNELFTLIIVGET